MSQIQMLLKEMDNESKTTRKMLSLIPDNLDWQPHPKSMTLRQLGTHIAELPGWVEMVLQTSELDFATAAYEPKIFNDTASILNYFEESLKAGRTALANATDDDLLPSWTLRNGNDIYSSGTRGDFIRITYSQIVHHRAQMGVYLRLLDIPIPGSYGPSADDHSF
jgi:uncharacterized damage-inducible protein DinB